MNAPNFNFDPDGPSERLPALASVGGARPPAREMRIDLARLASAFPENEGVSDYRRLFFLYLGLAVKYRLLLLGICSLALVVGLVVTFTATPVYRAATTIQIDIEAPKVVKFGTEVQPTNGDLLRFYQTQYDLLKSRSLAERVVADLDLGGKPDFIRPQSNSSWARLSQFLFPAAPPKTTANLEAAKAVAAAKVEHGLTVTPVVNSRLVRLSFDSQSPHWAQTVANGVANSFVAANLERRYGATAYARNFLKERLDELKLKLEDSEKALVSYADQKEIIASAEGKQSLADSDLAALNEGLQKAVMDRIRAQEMWEQAEASKGLALPQILQDASIQKLRDQRAVLMGSYQDKLSTFKPAYPDMVKLKAQIDQIDQEINAAAQIIKDSLKSAYAAALQNERALREKIKEAKTDVFDVRNKQIQYNILKREADTNRTLYEGLLQQYKDIGVAGAVGTNNIAIIDRAQLPGGPYKPNLMMNLAIAFAIGLVLAAIAIGVCEILDDTFKSPEEVEEQLGLAVLGIIPLVNAEVIKEMTEQPNSPVAEAYRSFRTALQFSTDHGAPKSILVTSARPGEGKSTTALALAVNFAQLGMRALLIDADLRNPSQHRNLKCDNASGLANYLAGMPATGSLFQETKIKGLFFMAAGPLTPNPAELLAGPKLPSLLAAAGEKFDVVVIDAPPVMGLADAPLLASVAAGTLLVMASADTRRGIVKASLKRLHFARARMIGAVMNKFDFRTVSYGYGYGYGYGHGATDHYGYVRQAAPAQVEHAPGS
jgi:succinoglycan biosynthesis transport protein ExoP